MYLLILLSGFFGRPDSIIGPPPVPEFPYTDLSVRTGVSVKTADKREYLEPKPSGPKFVDEGTQVCNLCFLRPICVEYFG